MHRISDMTQDPTLAAQAFDSMSHAVMVTDAQGAIVSVNAAYCRVSGWQTEDVLGQDLQGVAVAGQPEADAAEAMWNALLTRGHWQGELWQRRKSGASHPEFLTVDALHGEDGDVTGFVAVFADPGEVVQNEARQSYLAYHDALTDLPNRTLFLDRLDRAVSVARRKGGNIGVQFVDLDGFREINDSFGQEAGDLLLQAAAKRIKECLRESDTVARLADDRFGIILSVLEGAKGAREAAQRILAALCRPIYLAGDEISLGGSIGIALLPGDGVTASELAHNAELAMAEVKRQGKRAFAFHEDIVPQAAVRHAAV
jgi:diguanylate cyclase (GGDEF)-like protein/PAS domain S-box-containing protein